MTPAPPPPVASHSISEFGLSKGWYVPAAKPIRRAIIAVSGLEKEGKTHFALTAAREGPVFYHNFDFGTEGVVEDFVKQGLPIFMADYRMPQDWQKLPDEQKKLLADRVYTEFQAKWSESIKIGQGTIVVDTHSEEWEIRRLAKFGKLTQVMPHHYTEVNNDFRADIREAYDSGMNIILLQKLKKEYVNNNWNGKYEPAGYSDLPYLVQINVRAFRDPNDGQFKLWVKDCRQNAGMANQTYSAPFNEFTMFMNQVFG